MTCLLSLPPLLTNPFTEGSVDKQRNECEDFNCNWINLNHKYSELHNDQRCRDACHVATCFDTSTSRGQDHRVNYVCKNDLRREYFNKHSETDSGEIEADTDTLHNNYQNSRIAVNERGDKLPDQSNTRCHGIKRRIDANENTLDYMPSKRISPFLNTPKQRKDDRKKILKMSIKKIKQLNDPETFLRRTVLVNNTLKRLQSELREEKFRTKKRKSFNVFGVPDNDCLSDSYLSDDPFLSGVNEEITDDMTDTLIKNVLSDKPHDNKKDIDEKSEKESNDMEWLEDRDSVDTRLATTLSDIEEINSYQSSDGGRHTVMQPLKGNCNLSFVSYNDLEASGTCPSKDIHCHNVNT